MHFIKDRFKHGGRIGQWWWAMIFGAWTLVCSADVLVGKYGSDSFKVAWDAAWKLPKFGWEVWIIGLLMITVLMIFEGSYRHTRSLEAKLDGVPKLVCKGVSFHDNPIVVTEIRLADSPAVPQAWQRIVGRPTFYHLRIANEPAGITDRQTAEKVAARVQISREDGTSAANERLHRWEDSPGPAEAGKSADRLLPLDIPPSGTEYMLDIAMKYLDDDAFYTPNNETVLKASPDWREKDFEFPSGIYIAKIRLQGNNVDTVLKCRIVNEGSGKPLEITPLCD